MYLALLLILINFITLTQQKERLVGEYLIKYDHQYYLNNDIIIFSDSTYSKKLKNGGIVKGKVEYNRANTTLQDNFSTQYIQLSTSEVNKDTIDFSTIEADPTKHKPFIANYLHISINKGKLIKVK